MSLTDRVIKSKIFRQHADKLGEDDLKLLEENIREMLSSFDSLHTLLQSKMADQQGKDEFAEALEYLLTHEGQKKWQQDKS